MWLKKVSKEFIFSYECVSGKLWLMYSRYFPRVKYRKPDAGSRTTYHTWTVREKRIQIKLYFQVTRPKS